MAMIASTLVQETTRAERTSTAAQRGGATPSAGAPDEFAGLLQACAPTASPAAERGSEAMAATARAVQAAQTAQRAQEAQRAQPGATPERSGAASQAPAELSARAASAPAEPESSDRELAESDARDPAAVRSARAAAARAAANRPAARSVAGEDAAQGGASVNERSASAAQGDGAPQSLAQWLMQIGVIPALGALGEGGGTLPASGSDGPAGTEPTTADLAAGPAGQGLGRVYRRPAAGEEVMALGASSASGLSAGGPGFGGAFERAGVSGREGRGDGRDGRDGSGTEGGLLSGSQALSPATGQGMAAERLGGATGMASAQAQEAVALDAQAAAQSASQLGAAGWLVSGAPGAADPLATAAPVEVTLQTPFDDPGAASEVVMHVGRLAREGVTEASLHLNPAEMGPIRIQITLDGSQARIDFAASHAATRDLLESSLPALAQSLQDDGLTLADSRVGSVTTAEVQAAAAAAGGHTPPGEGSAGEAGRGAQPRHADPDVAGSRARSGAAAAAPGEGATPAGDALAGRAPARLRALDLYA